MRTFLSVHQEAREVSNKPIADLTDRVRGVVDVLLGVNVVVQRYSGSNRLDVQVVHLQASQTAGADKPT